MGGWPEPKFEVRGKGITISTILEKIRPLNGGQGWLRPDRRTAPRTRSPASTAGEAISKAGRSRCPTRTFDHTYLLRDVPGAINRTNPQTIL